MITGMRIKDFQSIEEMEVDCGRITVFHGESDTGKSAIVRALYALAFNSYPSGHVRDGAKHSAVSVEIDGTVKIGAQKGGGENYYQMMVGEEFSDWSKVGTDVPPEVVGALGWRALELDDGSRFTPNFHLQFDSPFLLTDSPSKRAKVLGSLTNVATLFAAIKMAGTWERRTKVRVDAQTEIVDRVEGQIEPKELEIMAVREGLGGLQSVLTRARQMNLRANQLTTILGKALAVSETNMTAKKVIGMMDASEPELDRIDELVPRIQGLQALYENIMSAQAQNQQAVEHAEKRSLEMVGAEKELLQFRTQNDICPMCGQGWGDHE